jgi:hypothetical protein
MSCVEIAFNKRCFVFDRAGNRVKTDDRPGTQADCTLQWARGEEGRGADAPPFRSKFERPSSPVISVESITASSGGARGASEPTY